MPADSNSYPHTSTHLRVIKTNMCSTTPPLNSYIQRMYAYYVISSQTERGVSGVWQSLPKTPVGYGRRGVRRLCGGVRRRGSQTYRRDSRRVAEKQVRGIVQRRGDETFASMRSTVSLFLLAVRPERRRTSPRIPPRPLRVLLHARRDVRLPRRRAVPSRSRVGRRRRG